MKKVILLYCLLMAGMATQAQTDSGSWLPSYQAVFNKLDLAFLSTNILLDRSLPMGKANYFGGNVDAEPCNLPILKELYHEVYFASYNTISMKHPDEMFSTAGNYIDQDIIPLAFNWFKYNTIKGDAVDNNWLAWNTSSELTDVAGRSTNPYTEESLFAFTPLKDMVLPNKTYQLYFTSEFFLTNFTSIPQSIQINLANGQGWQSINLGDKLSISFEANAVYSIEIQMVVEGKTWKAKSTIQALKPDKVPDFSKFIGLPIIMNENRRALVSGTFGNENGVMHTCIRKPFIIIDGIDFGQAGHQDDPNVWSIGNDLAYKGYYDKENLRCNSRGFVNLLNPIQYEEPQWANFPQMIKQLNDQGYDVLFLDFYNGADYIGANAQLFKELIKRLYEDGVITDGSPNAVNACLCEDAVVMGPSMGGQVARYALTQMEQEGINHHTRLNISFDSPHKGANIPIGVQCEAYFFKDQKGPAKEAVNRKLSRPATKELLLVHGDAEHFRTGKGMEMTHELRTDFINDLANMGNYPKKCRNVAISNGSKDLTDLKSLTPNGSKFCEFNQTKKKAFKVIINAWSIPGNLSEWGDYPAPFSIAEVRKPTTSSGIASHKIFNEGYFLPFFDNCPGSISNEIKTLATSVENNGKIIGDLTVPHQNFTFIPSISALDINTGEGNVNYNIGDNLKFPSQPSINNYPFSAYFSPIKLNEAHTEISVDGQGGNPNRKGNSNWILNEIGIAANTLQPNLPYFDGTTTYNAYNFADPRYTYLYSVVIGSNGVLNVNKEKLTSAYNNITIVPVTTSYFTIKTPLCPSNVVVDNGGMLEIGDDNQPMNNKGVVIIAKGSTLTLKTGSTLRIHFGSRLIIEDQAKLVIEPGAIIDLVGSESILEIRGTLELMPSASLETNGGIVLFKNTDVNNAMDIVAHGNNKVKFYGDMNKEKRLEVQNATLYLDANITEVSIDHAGVELGDDVQLEFEGKVKLNYSKFSHSNSNNPTAFWKGLLLSKQTGSDLNFNQTTFDQAQVALDFSYNTSSSQISGLSKLTFNNCYTGIYTKEGGIMINSSKFIKCHYGWLAESMSQESQINYATVKDCYAGINFEGKQSGGLVVSYMNADDNTYAIMGSSLNNSIPKITLRCSDFNASNLYFKEILLNTSKGNQHSAAVAVHGGKNVFTNSTIDVSDITDWLLVDGYNDFIKANGWTGQYASGAVKTTLANYTLNTNNNYFSHVSIAPGQVITLQRKYNGATTNAPISGSLLGNEVGGCSGFGGVDGDGLSKIETKQNDHTTYNLSIYPNPADRNVTISMDHMGAAIASINITDAAGRKIPVNMSQLLEMAGYNWQLELGSVPSGYYLLEVIDINGKRTTKSIVIAH
jgi:hypothetical protein